MRFKLIALLPLPLILVFAAVCLSMPERMYVSVVVAGEAGKALSLAGAAIAALAFERGDYLRKAWLRYGACYAFLLASDAVGLVGTEHGQMLTRGLLVAVGNVFATWGTWMLARAWTVAGFEEEEAERGRRLRMFIAAALLSLLVTGWPLVTDIRRFAGGEAIALVGIASDIGDVLTLALVAPVMHTAFAMRGGRLLWPWGLITLSNIAWIAWDASTGAMELRHIVAGPALVASESMRVLDTGWVLSAGLAQMLAVRRADEAGAPAAGG